MGLEVTLMFPQMAVLSVKETEFKSEYFISGIFYKVWTVFQVQYLCFAYLCFISCGAHFYGVSFQSHCT